MYSTTQIAIWGHHCVGRANVADGSAVHDLPLRRPLLFGLQIAAGARGEGRRTLSISTGAGPWATDTAVQPGARVTDVFLSYDREDQARAKLFVEAFEAQGLEVWWD